MTPNNPSAADRRDGSVGNTGQWLLGITVVAALLRLYRLDGQAVWIDETASLRNAMAFGHGGVTKLVEVDHVAPLHSILLWFAVALGGDGAIVLRLPSVIAGVLTVPAAYAVAVRMLLNQRVALITAALIAISPFAIWYAQEARMYALLLLCATVFVALSWPAVSRRLTVIEMAALTATSAIGFFTHQYMVLLAATFGLFLIIRNGPRAIWLVLRSARVWQWTATQVGASLLFSFWLAVTMKQAGAYSGLAKPAILLWTPYTLFTFVTGLSYGPSVLELHTGFAASVRHHAISIAIAGLSAVVIGAIGVVRAFKHRQERTAGLWLLLWLLLPMALAVAVTFVSNIQYNVRYVIICYPALIIFLALGIERAFIPGRLRWPVALAAAALVACMLVALGNWYANPAYAKEEVRPLARLMAAAPANTLMIADNDRISPVLAYYHAPVPAGPLGPDDAIAGQAPADFLRILAAKERAGLPRDIWLVEFRFWEIASNDGIRRWIEERSTLESEQVWPGVSLRRYRTKTGLVGALRGNTGL